MKIGFIKNNIGTTLVEMLLVLSIFILISGAVVNLYIYQGRVYNLEHAKLGSIGSTRRSLNEISQSVIGSRRVLSSFDFSGVVHSTATSTLVLELPSINSSGGVIEGSFDRAVYYLYGANLYRLVSPSSASARAGGEKIISSSVSAFSVVLDNPDVQLAKKIQIIIKSASGSGRTASESEESVELTLRNY